jgi:hypothetical protein
MVEMISVAQVRREWTQAIAKEIATLEEWYTVHMPAAVASEFGVDRNVVAAEARLFFDRYRGALMTVGRQYIEEGLFELAATPAEREATEGMLDRVISGGSP